jgi:hypothetical protein
VPRLFCIDPDDDVVVIAHDSVGAQVNRKNGGKNPDAIHNPLAPVFKVEPSY